MIELAGRGVDHHDGQVAVGAGLLGDVEAVRRRVDRDRLGPGAGRDRVDDLARATVDHLDAAVHVERRVDRGGDVHEVRHRVDRDALAPAVGLVLTVPSARHVRVSKIVTPVPAA